MTFTFLHNKSSSLYIPELDTFPLRMPTHRLAPNGTDHSLQCRLMTHLMWVIKRLPGLKACNIIQIKQWVVSKSTLQNWCNTDYSQGSTMTQQTGQTNFRSAAQFQAMPRKCKGHTGKEQGQISHFRLSEHTFNFSLLLQLLLAYCVSASFGGVGQLMLSSFAWAAHREWLTFHFWSHTRPYRRLLSAASGRPRPSRPATISSVAR